MCCPANKTKTVFLAFHREPLLYDIGNSSYIQGDVMNAKDEHERHQVMDVCQDGNVDRVTRILNLAYQECVNMLHPYTKADVAKESTLDNTFGAPDIYEMRLIVPEDFSKGTVALLKNLIHEYMVCRVLEDWMSITHHAAQPVWEKKVQELNAKILTCMNARGGKVRRPLKPF